MNMDSCLEIDGYKFHWEIENFNFLHIEKGECLKSPEFSLDTIGQMHLEIYPRGDLFDKEEYVIVCLNSIGRHKNCTVDCELKLSSQLCEPTYAKEATCKAPRWKFKKIDLTSSSIKIKEENFLTARSVLYIKCHFQLSKKVAEIATEEERKDLQILSDEMEKLYYSNQLCDFTVTYQNKKLKLHKALLYARAPKLTEELKIDECSEAELEIPSSVDATTDILKSFFVYLYTGKIPDLSTEVTRTFSYLCEKYGLTHLKRKLRCCPTESFVRTIIKADRKSFTWSIKNFEKLKPNEPFHGPTFSSGTIPSSDMHFTGHLEECDGILDLKISMSRLFPTKNVPIFINCKIVISNFTGDENYSYVGVHLFKEESTWNVPSFFTLRIVNLEKAIYRLDNLHTLCLKGKGLNLNIEFSISGKEFITEVIGSGTFATQQSIMLQSSDDIKNLSLDLAKLYNIFLPRKSDVVLHVGDVRFPSHMAILSARSTVFSRMFEHQMQEKMNEAVHITDIDVATLNLMLVYMYSGKLDMDLNYEGALKLYAASDKYIITSLKEKCSSILKSKMVTTNACDLLMFADMHSDAGLKAHVHDFICNQSDAIFNLPEWDEMIKDRPDLATDIFKTLVSMLNLHKGHCSQCIDEKKD